MPEILLCTELFVRPLRPNLVFRPYRVERLNQGLQRDLKLKLTLISALTGSGETMLLISSFE